MISFLVNHPVVALVVAIAFEQAGLPIASAPLLLLMGTLTGNQPPKMLLALFVAVGTCISVDYALFELGRIRRWNSSGACDAPYSTDSRFARIARMFSRHGGAAMFVGRFLPGPNLAAVVAGFSDVPRIRFVLLDALVSTLWTSVYLIAGYFLPKTLRSHFYSDLSNPSGWGVFIVGLTIVVLCALRPRRRQTARGTPRLEHASAIPLDRSSRTAVLILKPSRQNVNAASHGAAVAADAAAAAGNRDL